ncbi:MAG: proteasome assembly chaperone family protein [Candidatus Micrarchaeota archaeon]|nr:proteasome assembly chaperone family protein [Candidatus Micrarchaeota archaeon]
MRYTDGKDSMIEVRLFKDANLKGATFIEGFPGVGLVGPMAISYMVEKLEMEYVGYIQSNQFPPIISVHDNVPMPPVRIYYSERSKLVTIFAEFAIPLELTYEMAEIVYRFIKDQKLSKIISIGGVPVQLSTGKQLQGFAIASTPALVKEAQTAGLKPVGDGVSTGIGALIITKAAFEGTVPDINVLVPVDPGIIDPKYAELAIKNINKLLKLNIDTTALEKEAKEVEAKLREIIEKNRQTHESYKRAIEGAGTSSGPPVYA